MFITASPLSSMNLGECHLTCAFEGSTNGGGAAADSAESVGGVSGLSGTGSGCCMSLPAASNS